VVIRLISADWPRKAWKRCGRYGNKRIGSFLFLLFLKKNDLLDQKGFSNKALVALALLTAASEPGQKELMVRLIVNLISEEG
jgi:hypothetical protein